MVVIDHEQHRIGGFGSGAVHRRPLCHVCVRDVSAISHHATPPPVVAGATDCATSRHMPERTDLQARRMILTNSVSVAAPGPDLHAGTRGADDSARIVIVDDDPGCESC
ncbi:hypothetical protein QP185_17425 [Sphingomonas aerolata]|uniref:hypothetical protein n=1 Tax=Sphingomonas aerolata TaxID=185951 RepID=UPI002FDFD91E